jgi:L-amino acid N-acyltransferase
MQVTDARLADLPAILEIYNEVIMHSTAIYAEEPATLEERERWYRSRIGQGYPVLVATDETGVVGFASFGDFRAAPGYRHTVEHTVHVRVDKRGQGIGRALIQELLTRAAALGKHVMVAGIDAENPVSIHLHQKLGFEPVGKLSEVARKFDRWLDLLFMQRRLR